MAKEWTEEERKAFGDKMRAARAAKKSVEEKIEEDLTITDGDEVTVSDEVSTEAPVNYPVATGESHITPEPTTEEMLKRAIEAIGMLAELQKGNTGGHGNGAAVSNSGTLVGTVTKYSVDPARYPDPCERLSEEPKLQRFAFKDNYELQFTMTTSEYTTVDNIRMREPKFILKLIGVVYDPETGEKTNQRYLVTQQILHEDPESALIIARQNGVDVDSFEETQFLNEMRYLMMRDWLFEVFYPKKQDKREEIVEIVVGGKIVPSWTAASVNSSKVDFDQIDQMGGKFRS